MFPQVSLLVEDLPQAFFQVHLLVFFQVEAEVGVEAGSGFWLVLGLRLRRGLGPRLDWPEAGSMWAGAGAGSWGWGWVWGLG